MAWAEAQPWTRWDTDDIAEIEEVALGDRLDVGVLDYCFTNWVCNRPFPFIGNTRGGARQGGMGKRIR